MNALEAEQTLNALLKAIAEKKESKCPLDIPLTLLVSEEVHATLYALFPVVYMPALDLIDNHRIVKLTCATLKTRSFYKVIEKSPGNNPQTEFDVLGGHCFCFYGVKEVCFG